MNASPRAIGTDSVGSLVSGRGARCGPAVAPAAVTG
jgi:hypothetical protein